MHFHLIVCIVLAICLCSLPVLAASASSSRSAVGQATSIEKSSKDAAKDANAGKLGSAKAKAGQGFDTPAKSTSTVKTTSIKKENAADVARRENEAQKARDRERAKKYKLDDPRKAPPKP
jgi:hypothetical protein